MTPTMVDTMYLINIYLFEPFRSKGARAFQDPLIAISSLETVTLSTTNLNQQGTLERKGGKLPQEEPNQTG